MSQVYLVDGYNFILQDVRLDRVLHDHGLSRARHAFREEAETFAARSNVTIRLIFDGATDPMGHDDRYEGERVEINFTSRDEKADERLLAAALEAKRRGVAAVVVSDDVAGIREPLIENDCPVLSTLEFARRLRDRGKRIREPRETVLSDRDRLELETEFLARDAERKKQDSEAAASPRSAPAPPKAPPARRRKKPPPRAAAPPVVDSPRPGDRADEAGREARRERGRRKQERRLALLQSRRKRR